MCVLVGTFSLVSSKKLNETGLRKREFIVSNCKAQLDQLQALTRGLTVTG